MCLVGSAVVVVVFVLSNTVFFVVEWGKRGIGLMDWAMKGIERGFEGITG